MYVAVMHIVVVLCVSMCVLCFCFLSYVVCVVRYGMYASLQRPCSIFRPHVLIWCDDWSMPWPEHEHVTMR